MTTITKEWLQKTITSIKSARDEIPFGLDEDQNNMLTALKIALASLEREQIRHEHAKWSDSTFGCVGPIGPLKHLSKEALEAAAEPDDLSEWADMQFLLWDAQRRAGISDAEITAAMEDKLKINMKRQWPEPKDGEPRLHIKEPGNSPVTPDSWISCSERMPKKNQNVLISVNFDSDLVEPLICSARYTGSTFRRGEATIKPGNGVEQATHWMPLPEPPQEVNRG
ncbi:TPA: dATP/dGTP pyrophosphohydrolase domain-containing protein [Escherichia coli]